MDRMFLRDVEDYDGRGPRADAIRQAREKGQPVPQIAHLFAFKPEATDHLSRFSQAVMRGPSELSPGMRELIAAFTSNRNDCLF